MKIEFPLWPKQMLAFRSPATELLYGGAKGGGKSYLMRVCAICWCMTIPGLQVYLFRRTSPELRKSHLEGPTSFENLLAPLLASRRVTIVADQIRFWNGSRIHLAHAQYEHNLSKYRGVGIHVLMIDQLEEFTEPMYRLLRAEVRMAGIKIPSESNLRGRFPRVLLSDNPGGVGDGWIMQQFIDPAPELEIWESPAGFKRQFIPALLEDNPSIELEDPMYRRRLEDLGNPMLVEALLLGRRGLVAGSFFSDVWNRPDYQILKPFSVPAGWWCFASFDWGSASPASLGIWAVANGEEVTIAGDRRWFPPGSMIRMDELYTVVEHDGKVEHNVGQRLTNAKLGLQVAALAAPYQPRFIAADPQVFQEMGGPSIGDQMIEAAQARGYGLPLVRADNARVPGWQKVRKMMHQSAANHPEGAGLWVVDTCRHWMRTMTGVQKDPARGGEDLKKEGEDHCADDTRYAVMMVDSGRLESEPLDLY